MTKTERWLKRHGFAVTGTGGNCTGWTNTSPDGTELTVASECNHKILESDYRKGFVGAQARDDDPVMFRSFEQLQRWVKRQMKR